MGTMKYVSVSDCLKASKGSIFKLVLLMASRGRELSEGAKTTVKNLDPDKPLSAVVEEIVKGEVELK
jgi:DNA-directed RNA polymerase omega subunit